MELYEGEVLDITFRNEENGYSVVKVLFKDELLPVYCVGTMPMVSKGNIISVKGEWKNHQKYGRQFYVEQYSVKPPSTEEGIIAFLSSGIIEGVGEKRARMIVEKFGKETLEIIEKNPERLLEEIPRLGKKIVEKIVENLKKDKPFQKLILFLSQFDISLSTAHRIYKEYGEEAIEKISTNPYALCEDIWGIGFIKADRIAQKMGLPHDSYQRIQTGILHIMRELSEDGHTCAPFMEVVEKATELLNVAQEKVIFSLDNIVNIGMLYKEDEWLYLPYLYKAEKIVAKRITESTKKKNLKGNSEQEIIKWLEEYEKTLPWKLHETQKKAIIMAILSPSFLLTGGPGTGKTTILKVVVKFFEKERKKVILAAPTGRAAQRITEVTGLNAQTIHRVLEYTPYEKKGGFTFNRNENNPVEADVVIVDEVSMVDIYLMSRLVAALQENTQLILVGDSNQLPSVGPGNVLSDIVASGVMPHVNLTNIFRQAKSSRIISAAHEINHGITPYFSNSKEDNCFFIEEKDPEVALSTLIELVCRRLPSSYQYDPVEDIQILSPMHKGVLGTENINNRLQQILKRSSKMIRSGNTLFYVGDKVMQIKNNYEKNVFNGDIGIIIDIMEGNGLIVNFQGNIVSYDSFSLDELTLAYCISIHKSQGSEFNCVIIPLVTQHYIMLQRNLIYTALTRAKKMCIFVGSRKALHIAVQSDKAITRYSRLKERITSLLT